MQQVKRLIGLSSLIIFFLGLINFLEHHFFFYPFQINEVLFFIISIVTLFKDKINQKPGLILFGTFAFLNLMSHDLVYSFFLNYEQILKLFESGWMDLLKLVNLLIFLSFMIYTSFMDEKKKIIYWSISSFIVCILLATALESQLFIILAYTSVGLMFLKTILFKNYGALILFLGFLESIKYMFLLLANF
jgi:hypothetical protein